MIFGQGILWGEGGYAQTKKCKPLFQVSNKFSTLCLAPLRTHRIPKRAKCLVLWAGSSYAGKYLKDAISSGILIWGELLASHRCWSCSARFNSPPAAIHITVDS